jgi:hypothetical protein
MTDGDDEVKIEINAPPKSIEISPLGEAQPPTETQPTVSQTPVLTGGIQQAVQQSLLNTDPGNVKFVMGPNGQLIAMHQPPFVWKDFFIGGGIPFALMFIPILVLMIGSSLGYGEYQDETIDLVKDENTTMYRGEFTLEEDNFISWCAIWDAEMGNNQDIHCDRHDDYEAKILYPHYDGQEVGSWNNDNGTIYFDTGKNYGDEIQFKIEYYSEAGAYGFFQSIEDSAGFTCCLGLLLSMIFLILGFSQGKPGMGWGGVSALISFPVVSILALGFMW